MRKSQSEERKADAIETGRRMKEVRRESGLSLSDIADRLNRDYGASTNKGMLSKYENGVHEPSATMIYCLSLILGVSTEYLLGTSDEKNPPIPTQGTDGTGYVLDVFSSMKEFGCGVRDPEITEIIPKSWLVGGREYFAYKISGGRFAPRYYAGDIVIFEKKVKVAKEQVALVSVGDSDAFLSLVTKKREGKLIIPLDPAYDERFYTTEEVASVPVRIIGVAVQVRRNEVDR